nr:hypothetical protein Itr_chr09CG15780 [Ipomoea trifida]
MSNANNQLPAVSSSTTPIFIPINLPAIQTSTSIPFTPANRDVESHNNSVVPVSPVILQDNASSFGDRAHTSSRYHVQSASSSAESTESVSSIPQVSNMPTETAPGTSQISNQQAASTGTSSQACIALVLGVEDSDAAAGDSGPLGNESGELGRKSGLLEDAELSVEVAGVSSRDSGLCVE